MSFEKSGDKRSRQEMLLNQMLVDERNKADAKRNDFQVKLLKTNEELTETDRKALFKEKKVHQIYLSLFIRDGSTELESIANAINEELN